MTASLAQPALLGGTPVRPEGCPVWPPDDPDVIASLQAAIRNRSWGKYLGEACPELIRVISQMHGDANVWLCSSGTVAVELALRGLGVGPGDEVVMSAYDFKANFTDIALIGATPVLVDVRPDDWQLDASRLREALSDKTRAVLVSHLHGGLVDLTAVRTALEGTGIPVLEDACQNPGTWIKSQRAGQAGDVGVFSFGGSKLTCAGRGGAVITPSAQILERIRRFVMRGNDLSPLSELQAAALVPQWKKLDEYNARRGQSVQCLLSQLPAGCGLRPLVPVSESSQRGYYKVGFEYQPGQFEGLSRSLFCRAMQAEGIGIYPGFRALHRIHASRRFRAAGPLTEADRVDERVVVLHHPVLLEEAAAIDQIPLALDRIRKSAGAILAAADTLPPVEEPSYD